MTETQAPHTLPTLLAQIDTHVPEGAPIGTRRTATAVLQAGAHTHRVTVNARIDPQGRRRLQYLCDEVRVERSVLLRLTCPEQECPQARAVRAQWDEWHRGGPPRERVRPPSAEPLMQEQPVRVGRHHCTARPARFACFTPCPHDAHPPMTFDKTGYDLFEDGRCVGGGLVHVDGVARPRLPSVQAAEAYVLARHLEALVLCDGLARRGPGAG